MRERPILFSAPMVLALLAGTKTQTRRIVKPQPELDTSPLSPAGTFHWPCQRAGSMVDTHEMPSFSPYGTRGDRLWVKETWQAVRWWRDLETGYYEDCTTAPKIPKERGSWSVAYAANDPQADDKDRGFVWRPSIFMPRWASRITLEVTKVRVERLQQIDELDALAEGVEGQSLESVLDGVRGEYVVGKARDAYRQLWDEINGERANWDSNPWVWVVEFAVLPVATSPRGLLGQIGASV